MRDDPGRPASNQGDPKLRKPSGLMFFCIHELGAQDMDSKVSFWPPLGGTRCEDALEPVGERASVCKISHTLTDASPRRWPNAGMILRRNPPTSESALSGAQAAGLSTSKSNVGMSMATLTCQAPASLRGSSTGWMPLFANSHLAKTAGVPIATNERMAFSRMAPSARTFFRFCFAASWMSDLIF